MILRNIFIAIFSMLLLCCTQSNVVVPIDSDKISSYTSDNTKNKIISNNNKNDTLREYPVILTIDNTKPILVQKEMVFAAVHQALSDTFTIIDGYQIDKEISNEVMSTTGSGSITYQDILFRKYTVADICVYLWCEITPYEGQVLGKRVTFYETRMGARVVNTVNKQLLADVVKSTGRQHFNSGSEDDKQRRAVKMILPPFLVELKTSIMARIGDIAQSSFRIKGIIELSDKLQIFKTVLKDLQFENHFKIKKVVSESAHFEYFISNPSRNLAGMAELITETAEAEGLMLNVRAAESTNNKLLQISLQEEADTDF